MTTDSHTNLDLSLLATSALLVCLMAPAESDARELYSWEMVAPRVPSCPASVVTLPTCKQSICKYRKFL